MAKCGQFNIRSESGVPDMFFRARLDCGLAIGHQENNFICWRHNGLLKWPCPATRPGRTDEMTFLGIVEPSVLAVRRVTRISAAEVARRHNFSIAFTRQQLDAPRLVLNSLIHNA